MTDEVSKQLDAVNSEMVRRLSECEEQLKSIVAEYQAWSKTALFAVLDQSTKLQIKNSIRAYLDSNGKRLQAARAGLEALRGLSGAASVIADPLADFASPPPVVPSPALPPVPQVPAVRLGLREPLDPVTEPLDDPAADDFIPVESKTESAMPSNSGAAQAGFNKGRPSPRGSQGSAAPVAAGGDGFRRSPDVDNISGNTSVGGQRKMASSTTKRKLAATIRSIGEAEITTGERPSEVSIGEADEDNLVTGRSMAPDAVYEAAMRQAKKRQKIAIAAKSAESDDIMMDEAEILDDVEKLIGRATGVRQYDKQVIVDRIELFLENMPTFSSDEPAFMVKEIVKARRLWRFHGSKKSFSAMIAHVNRKGYDESDSGVLLLEDVGLAAGVKQTGSVNG